VIFRVRERVRNPDPSPRASANQEIACVAMSKKAIPRRLFTGEEEGGGRRIPLRVRGTKGTLGANRFARLVFYPKERSLYFNEVILLHSSVPVSERFGCEARVWKISDREVFAPTPTLLVWRKGG